MSIKSYRQEKSMSGADYLKLLLNYKEYLERQR